MALSSADHSFGQDLASPDWMTVRAAIERASDWLRQGDGTHEEVEQLGRRLAELAQHPKWEVRRAVAHALEYLRHFTFQLAIGPLLVDRNASVRQAAERVMALSVEAAHSDVLSDQHGERLQRWLGEIETRHGRRTREAAMRLAERYSEMLVREASHEVLRVLEPLDLELTELDGQLDRPRLDRAGAKQSLRQAQDRVKLLTAIVKGLRQFTAKATLEFERAPLRPIVADAVSLVRDRLGPQAPQFAVELGIDARLQLDAHRVRLVQAFSNLIQNAVESYEGRPGQRRLVVAAREEQGGRLVLTFADHGNGMDEDMIREAFQLYSTSKPQGTGFGLPLATKIIKNEHRGVISIASTIGKGTTVNVVLPIERNGEPA